MTYRSTWSDRQEAQARRLWLEGADAASIGVAVGKTRLAVIGRADRKGWGPHPKAHRPGAKWRRVSSPLTVIEGGRHA